MGKDTWIRGEADLDAFIIFPEGTRLSDMQKHGLELGKFASNGRYTIAYAEHPYTRARVKGLDIDIVPCIGVRDPSRIATAVDRTPFHKRYVIERLTAKLRGDIRLLKRFMMTLGVYGAEIRVKGFSGYLVELLVIHYRGFAETLQAASNWKEGVVLDPQGFYSSPEDVRTVFEHDPLIVIDPVDRRRNVAAAVANEKMAIFVSSAREFLNAPSRLYFTHTPLPPRPAALSRMISKRKIPLIGVQVDCPKLVPDILWGQLYKSLAGLATLLGRYGFGVVYSDVWTDERSIAVFLFELNSLELPMARLHGGPSVYMKDQAGRFLDKHLGSQKILAGPWIEGNRWLVEVKRRTINPETLLERRLGEARLGSEIEKLAQKRKRIETCEDVIRLAGRRKGFFIFLERFLRRRPVWFEWRSRHPRKNS